jgi:cysteine desulfuration protein SufE
MKDWRIEDKIQQYTDILSELDSDFDRYEFIMDLGDQMPVLPSDQRLESNRIEGCQSNLYVKDFGTDTLQMKAYGDSHIVKGMAALILDIFNGAPKHLVKNVNPNILEKIGIKSILTPGRQNGVGNLIRRVYEYCGNN